MTDKQKSLVQSSFAKIAPVADIAAELFYGKLFELDRGLQSIFMQDMGGGRRMFMNEIVLSINELGDLKTLVPKVYELGKLNAILGVEDHHYRTIGEALIWTLDKGLGDTFTQDVREAWRAIYAFLADTMMLAQKDVEERKQMAFASRLNVA